MDPIPIALAIRILAHPPQRSLTLWIARHLSPFSTTPRSIHPSHTHLSTPHLRIRHRAPQRSISPLRTVLFILLPCIVLSTIRHLQGTPAVRLIPRLIPRYITTVQAVQSIHHHRIRRSILHLRTHHRDIARHIHQNRILQSIRQSRTRLLAHLSPQCILLPRTLRFIPLLRTHQ